MMVDLGLRCSEFENWESWIKNDLAVFLLKRNFTMIYVDVRRRKIRSLTKPCQTKGSLVFVSVHVRQTETEFIFW